MLNDAYFIPYFHKLSVFRTGNSSLDDPVFVNLPNFGVGKIFNPQNMLYIHTAKNSFRLEFEQIP